MSYNRKANFEDAGTRLDQFWSRELADDGVSRSRIKQWIESGRALVDGQKVTKGKFKLSGGEELVLSPEVETTELSPEAEPLSVLYEDGSLLVLDKPCGLTTHPAPTQMTDTLVHRLLHHYPDMASEHSGMDPMRPGIVHRLDKDTSGLIAVARTEPVRLRLAGAFADREVDKRYLAIVFGVPETTGTVDAPIGRHPTIKTRMAVTDKGGRDSLSEWKVLWSSPDELASLVEVKIHTGRTHQIRVHMAHAGHPLLGDDVYGSRHNAELARELPGLAALAARQMLHAWRLEIAHPESGEPLRFTCPPPQDFQTLLRALHRTCLRVGLTGMPGCGKSTLLGLLRGEDLPVFSSDAVVAETYGPGGDGAELLQRRFGGAFSRPDGAVDKQALFRAMVEQPDLRREVMAMVHPIVEHAVRAFWEEHSEEDIAVAEVPLLFEGDWPTRKLCDLTVFVDCPDEKRTGELRRARGLDAETLAVFDSWQWPSDRKKAAADMVVDNAGGLAALKEQARGLVRALRDEVRARAEAFETVMQSFWDGGHAGLADTSRKSSGRTDASRAGSCHEEGAQQGGGS